MEEWDFVGSSAHRMRAGTARRAVDCVRVCGATTEGDFVASAASALRRDHPCDQKRSRGARFCGSEEASPTRCLMIKLKFGPAGRFVASSGMGLVGVCGAVMNGKVNFHKK
jgi:hypothetical protein